MRIEPKGFFNTVVCAIWITYLYICVLWMMFWDWIKGLFK